MWTFYHIGSKSASMHSYSCPWVWGAPSGWKRSILVITACWLGSLNVYWHHHWLLQERRFICSVTPLLFLKNCRHRSTGVVPIIPAKADRSEEIDIKIICVGQKLDLETWGIDNYGYTVSARIGNLRSWKNLKTTTFDHLRTWKCWKITTFDYLRTWKLTTFPWAWCQP